MHRLLAAALLALAWAPGRAEAPATPAPHDALDAVQQARLNALLERSDAEYAGRLDPARLEAAAAALAEAEALAPGAYGVLWRKARLQVWRADDPFLPEKEKSRLGKAGWELADRATAANPEGVEGWYWAAGGMGNYALGIGVLRALGEGIEGKFKDRLRRAETLDPDYLDGAVQTAWGRFWYELPWPKHDARKSRRALDAALAKNPDNVRARVYLSDLMRKRGDREAARAELERALLHPPGRYDAAEEARWQAVARRSLESWK
jgi:tetratricopeptide (TPR) repeat protein